LRNAKQPSDGSNGCIANRLFNFHIPHPNAWRLDCEQNPHCCGVTNIELHAKSSKTGLNSHRQSIQGQIQIFYFGAEINPGLIRADGN
jgi:hypothetical protein